MTIEELCREYLDKAERGLILTRRGEAKSSNTLYSGQGADRAPHHPADREEDGQGFHVDRCREASSAMSSPANPPPTSRRRRGAGDRDRREGDRGPNDGPSWRDIQLRGRVRATGRTIPVNGISPPKGRNPRMAPGRCGLPSAWGNASLQRRRTASIGSAILASRAATLTGCRLDEIEGLLKTEVDTVGMALRLGETKTGKSIRPVGSAVIAVLKAASAKSKSKYVFPPITTNTKHHTGLTRWLQKISAKDVPGITSHGLRHSFSSTAEDLGYSIPTIKALVGHSTRERDRRLHPQDRFCVARGGRSDRAAHRRCHDRTKIKQGGPTSKGMTTIGAARVAPEKLVRTSLPRRPSCGAPAEVQRWRTLSQRESTCSKERCWR